MEGPSLVLLSEELAPLVNKKIVDVSGNTKEDMSRLEGRKILAIGSWGKHFLMQFDKFYLRVHFLLFGSYRFNERKGEQTPRLSLEFAKDELNFYSCSVKLFEGTYENDYDWKIDVMSEAWDEKIVCKKIKAYPEAQVCDIILNQEIFAGAGNIIKNEVLFNLHMHPETRIGDLSAKEIKALARETRDYSHRFYEWKKIFELRKHWQVYKQRKCPRCGIPLIFRKTGKGERSSYYCGSCQRLGIGK